LKKVENIQFQFEKDQRIVVIDKLKYPLDSFVRTTYGVLRFLPNPNYKQQENDNPLYFSIYPIRTIAKSLTGRLNVSAVSKMSSVIDLSIQDEVPKRAEDILNSLIENYDKAAINEKNDLAKNTLAFVEDRLSYVTKDLDSIEKKIQQYRSGQG